MEKGKIIEKRGKNGLKRRRVTDGDVVDDDDGDDKDEKKIGIFSVFFLTFPSYLFLLHTFSYALVD